MSQTYFEMNMHTKCTKLEVRNAELEAENEALKAKVQDLGFEVVLLRDVCDYDEEERKDEIIAELKQTLDAKDAEIAQLKAELAEKETVIANFNLEPGELLDNFNQVFTQESFCDETEDQNTKMGEDTGEDGFVFEKQAPKKRVRVYKYTKPDGVKRVKVIDKKTGNRKYTSRRKPVTNRIVMNVLQHLYKKKGKMTRMPGLGHDYKGVRYAQYYGRLNKAGDIGTLKTIILSSEKKVYQLNEKDKHIELLWQNDKNVLLPAYGSINLLGEGKNYQCSLNNVFKTELSVYI